jgi:uncharacterized membrane protein
MADAGRSVGATRHLALLGIRGGIMTDLVDRTDEDVSSWAVGGTLAAATVMILVGLFQFFQGLTAIINDEFFVVVSNYAFEFDTTAWGWIHLVVGLLVVISGAYLFAGSRVAGAVALFIAALAAVANFFFIPFYPFWSLLIIALAIYVIWSVSKTVFEA